MFLFETRVVPQNFFFAPSFGEQIQCEFDRQSRSLDDGLAGQNGRVSNDVVMPIHEPDLSPLVKLRPQLELSRDDEQPGDVILAVTADDATISLRILLRLECLCFMVS